MKKVTFEAYPLSKKLKPPDIQRAEAIADTFGMVNRVLSDIYSNPLAGTTYMMTAQAFIRQHVEAMDAMKNVMEFFAAQEAMELFKDRPLEQHIFNQIVQAGIRALVEPTVPTTHKKDCE